MEHQHICVLCVSDPRPAVQHQYLKTLVSKNLNKNIESEVIEQTVEDGGRPCCSLLTLLLCYRPYPQNICHRVRRRPYPVHGHVSG